MSAQVVPLRRVGWVAAAAVAVCPVVGGAQRAQRTPRTPQIPRTLQTPRASHAAATPGVSAAAPATPGDSNAAPLVFDGVTVVDVEQGKVRPAQRVVIVRTRIQAMGAASKIPLPAGAQVVDARGQYVIPGLWDLRTHAGEHTSWNSPIPFPPNFVLPLFLANGVTGIRGGEDPLGPSGEPRARDTTGTLVQPPRRLLSDPFPVTPENIVWAYERAQQAKAAGAMFFDMPSLTFGRAKMARDVGLFYGGPIDDPQHRKLPFFIAVEAASDSGMRVIDHLTLAGGLDTLCWGAVASLELCQPVAARLRRNGTWVVPTLIGLFGDKDSVVVHTAPRARAVFQRYRSQVRAFLRGGQLAGNWLRDSAAAALAPAAAAAAETGALALFQRADMPLLAGTDGVEWLPVTGFALQAELAMYVAEGLTPLQALQAATLNPAKLLHATDSLGTVAVGKLADLVLLEANPLEDITNVTQIRAVVANGRYYDRKALDAVLAGVQAVAKQKGFTGMLP